MYDITKTRMLLTTAAFAVVAALFAGGASAKILGEDGSDIGARPAAAVSATVAQSSSRLTGLLRAARMRDQELGALTGQATTARRAATTGSTRYGYVVGGELIAP
jgi:hypothetical protein